MLFAQTNLAEMAQWVIFLRLFRSQSQGGPSSSSSSSAAKSPPSRNFAGEFAKFACASDTDSADSDDEGGREFKRRQEQLKREQKRGGSGKG